jgi:threonine dehydrogenase-like Zn-dependent dehydrogenase
MKALILKDFGSMEVVDRPDPIPGEGELRIKLIATGICGSDIHGFTGETGRRVPGQVMGHESVGYIDSLGAGLEKSGFEVGQLATFNPVVIPTSDLLKFAGREQHSPNKYVIGVEPTISAGFAQLIVVPSHNVVVLPSSIPITYGALIEPLAVAVHAVRRAHIDSSQSVLVLGGGPIGQAIVVALKMIGVKNIVVSEIDSSRRELLGALGANVIDPNSDNFIQLLDPIFSDLADATIDAVGNSETMSTALMVTKIGGTICLVGMASKRLDLNAFEVSVGERTIVGSFTYSAQDFQDAAKYIADAPDVVSLLISREVSLDEANRAFLDLSQHDGTPGKVLVRFDR